MSEGRTVKLDATGAGSVMLAPSIQGWKVTRITTTGASTVPPTLTVRRGSAGGPVVDVTRFGNSDVSETDLDVYAGESLVAVYSGGTAGASMVFYIEGSVI